MLSSLPYPQDRPRRTTRRFLGRWLASTGVVLVLMVAGCARTPPAPRDEIVVFAAASLRDALQAVGARYAQRADVDPVFSFAGSNVLARQLIAAPKADLFISANPAWLDAVVEHGHIDPRTRRTVLGNRLVVVAPRDSPLTMTRLADLATLDFRSLALGDPAGVPAGIYARETLERVRLETRATLWSLVATRVVPTADARAAVALVASRDDTVGVVYRTDALVTPRVRTLWAISPEMTPTIRYEAAVLATSRVPTAAAGFLDFLTGDDAMRIFLDHGFAPRPTP